MVSTATPPEPIRVTVDAELRTPAATVHIERYEFSQPVEHLLVQDDGCRLDLSVTSRTPNAQVSFLDHWAPHRYEALGRLFLLPPGEAVNTRTDCGNQISVVCLLRKAWFNQYVGSDFAWTDGRLGASVNVPVVSVQHLLRRLGAEARNPGFASQALTEAIAIQVVIELNRFYLSIDEVVAAGGLPAWRLRLIDERLREVRAPPTLTELATMCGLSIRQLTRGFRESRGSSIGDHIAGTRIDNAIRLLGVGESVKSIAYSMGFGSPSSFCYAFRNATGSTPRQYRLQVAPSG